MKKLRFILIALLTVSLILTGCNSNQLLNEEKLASQDLLVEDLNGIDESKLTLYTINLELDTKKMSYKGKQYVNYVNNTDRDLEEIYFHVYPNAFKDFSTIPVLFDTRHSINQKNYVPGYIDIKRICNNKKDLKWNVEGDKDTILHIDLDKALKKGKSIELYLEYKVKLPSTKDRFGYHDKGVNLGNCYPIVAVYDEDGWNLDPYKELGDPFYSEVSNYKLNINVSKEMEIATSGKILSDRIKGDKRTYEVEANLIRDFAWAGSEDFKINKRLVDGTVIKLYSTINNSRFIEDSLDIGEKAIRSFNKVFGKYPYGQYSIVVTKFPSGMEYPGIVFISDQYQTLDPLETVIVHETAHQWWYGLVGNDQIDEAWLDESLATYSEVIYFKEVYGEERAKEHYDNIRYGYEYAVDYLANDKLVNKSLSKFTDWNDYGALAYNRGGMFLHRIREEFGEDVLYNILNEYYNRYKFHIAKTEDFIGVCEDITGESFDDLIKEYLNGGRSLVD